MYMLMGQQAHDSLNMFYKFDKNNLLGFDWNRFAFIDYLGSIGSFCNHVSLQIYYVQLSTYSPFVSLSNVMLSSNILDLLC